MNLDLKKGLIFLLLTLFLFACEKDDNSKNTDNDLNEPIITESGSININALRRVNPNFKLENLAANGTSAIELLTDSKYKSITLEILSVEGFEPSEFAKQTLLDFIGARLNKPNGVKVIERSINSPGIDKYDVQNVFSEVEVINRTQFSNGSDLAIFVYFADKDNKGTNFEKDMNSAILGTAYLNTSFVIYKETINKIAANNASDIQNIEAGTLNHEFCHLLGLVNGPETPMSKDQGDHEDFERDSDGVIVNDTNGKPKGNNHCDVEFCLMEANARLIRDMMGRGDLPILELDPKCIKDLQAIGGK